MSVGTSQTAHRPASRLVAWLAILILAVFLALAPLTGIIAAMAGTLLVVGIALQPVIGLLLIPLAIPASGLPLPTLGALGVVDLLVAATLAGWFLRSCAKRCVELDLPPLAWPALVMVWIFGASLLQAASWAEGVPEWLKWLEFVALFIGAAQILERRHVSWLLASLFCAGLIEVALGAYQFARQVGPEAFVLMGRFMRAYGTFRQPNPYAGYLGYLVPVAASLTLATLGRWWSGRTLTGLLTGLVCLAVTVALLAGIAMSWSRGSWVGIGVALVAVAAFRSRLSATFVLSGVAIGVLLVALFGTTWLPQPVVARLADLNPFANSADPARTEITDENFAVLERLAHWDAAERMFTDRPWLGVGIGNYPVAYRDYASPHWYDPLGHAHNVYLNLLAETGAIGVLGFGVFWLGAFWTTIRARRANWSIGSALAVGVLGTLTYCTIHNVFDNLFVGHMQLQLALLLAMLHSGARV